MCIRAHLATSIYTMSMQRTEVDARALRILHRNSMADVKTLREEVQRLAIELHHKTNKLKHQRVMNALLVTQKHALQSKLDNSLKKNEEDDTKIYDLNLQVLDLTAEKELYQEKHNEYEQMLQDYDAEKEQMLLELRLKNNTINAFKEKACAKCSKLTCIKKQAVLPDNCDDDDWCIDPVDQPQDPVADAGLELKLPTCVGCLCQPANHIFPCGHLSFCQKCSFQWHMKKRMAVSCVLCRKEGHAQPVFF